MESKNITNIISQILVVITFLMIIISHTTLSKEISTNKDIENKVIEIEEKANDNSDTIELITDAIIEVDDRLQSLVETHDKNVSIYNDNIQENIEDIDINKKNIDILFDYLNRY